MQSNAVVLLSGGLDSSTAMWKIKDDYPNIHALTFSYGAMDDEVVIGVTKRLSDIVGASHKVITLPWLEDFSRVSGSALVTGDVPELQETDLIDVEKAKSTAKKVWVPARNFVFLSIAASFAESIEGGAHIIAGFDREEAATFPDNSAEFVRSINAVLEFAVIEKDINIIAPLIDMDKNDIATLALELGVPVDFTSSCYNPLGLDNQGRPVHCGKCESCMRRRRGFKVVGGDRTVYRR